MPFFINMLAFPPILAEQPRLLILGSMPGLKSLEAKQYYAHPRNSFWLIMAQIFDFNGLADYDERVLKLINRGVCLWDVLQDCERIGSLDINIVRDTERVNDFDVFLSRYPQIQVVAFNGQAARKIFHRHFKHLYDRHSHISWVDLPSSSPAHAAISPSEKAHIWADRLNTSSPNDITQ